MSLLAAPEEALKNNLLAALSDEEFTRLLPVVESVTVGKGEVIYESGEKMDYIYFPTTAVISLLCIMESKATTKICVVGNEGFVGIALVLGDDTTPNRAIVQSAGNAVRMKADTLRNEFVRGGRFQQLLLRYTQALLTQISQTAACNCLHTAEQKFCRLLLLSHDRLPSDTLVMTQDQIANMLGVRRECVTHAARHLQDLDLISYARGTITIHNRKGLEAKACECYKVVKAEYDRLFGN